MVRPRTLGENIPGRFALGANGNADDASGAPAIGP